MIFDTLQQAPVYRSLGDRIAQGLDWLQSFAPGMDDGRYDIAGDQLFALVQSYETSAASEKRFESHRNYLDIQYVAAGRETIYYAPLRDLLGATTYDPVKDFSLYDDPLTMTLLPMVAGTFAIFFPGDGHKPGCDHDTRERIKKVVLKVSL